MLFVRFILIRYITEACLGYFGIRDIHLFIFWDMGYSGIFGYGILKFILGYELN